MIKEDIQMNNLEKLLVNLFTFTPYDKKEYEDDNISDPSFKKRWDKKIKIYKGFIEKEKGGVIPEKEIRNYWYASPCTKLTVATYFLVRKPIQYSKRLIQHKNI